MTSSKISDHSAAQSIPDLLAASAEALGTVCMLIACSITILSAAYTAANQSVRVQIWCLLFIKSCCVVWKTSCNDACRLVIVGGGYIAAEQACIYRNFGADVHMFFRGAHILGGQPSPLTPQCLPLPAPQCLPLPTFHAVAHMLLWPCPCKHLC